MSKPSERLRELGIVLPPVSKPVGAYVPIVRHGDLLFLSGQIPLQEGRVAFSGRVGFERTLDDAQKAARICAITAIAIAADAAGGIDNIARVVKVVVYVASHEGFNDQHKVANGASELLVEIFGESGKHARAAIGTAELPLGATVEVDVTFAVGNA
ncbi:MAG: RidA family protein [Phycisphaerae bacterium]